MAFGIGINAQQPGTKKPAGSYTDVACECWFTSGGRVMPLMLKVKTEDGTVKIIRKINVISSEVKNFCGIPAVEYICEPELEERILKNARLIFYPSDCRWTLVV